MFGNWQSLILLVPMVAVAALWVGALISIGRSSTVGTERAVWVLVVVVAPLLGAIAWFAIGKARPQLR